MARVLTRDEALAVVNRWDLKGTWAAKARNLVSLLDMDGQVALTAVQAALFQGKEWDSMVKTLQRRVDRFNGAARAVHSAATVVMTGKTEDDVVRFESQEGDAPGEPRLLEYEAAQKKGIVIEDVRSFDLAPVYAETDDPRPIVLLTFNRHETAAILKAFCPDGAPARKLRHGVPYYDLGEAAGRRVVLTVSRQGVSRAQQAAEEACEAWSPQALIGVGIAFGVDRNEQRIGDVLVSQSTQEYDLGRVNPDGTVTPRGGEAEASDSWVRAILMADHVARARGCPWPKLRFGCLLSGSKLVDSLSYRDSLLELYRNRQVVGGEMEALGLARVSQRAYRQAQNVAWIVVKGICDFADGDVNNPFKQANQKVAAAHAARVVYSVLTDRFLDTPLETAPDGECPNEPKLTDFRSVAAELFQSMPVEPLAVDKTAEPPAQRRGTSADKVALEQMLRWADDDGGTPLFALLGEVGIGKTVTCQAFAHALRERRRHDQTTRWPLYFDLREASLPKGRVPSVDRIMKECARNGWYRSESKVKVADIWRWIYQGGVVIFDGLDEVLNKLDDDEGKKLTNRLLSVVNEAQARGTGGRPPKVVVSSRTQFFRTLRDERNRLTGGLANDKTAASFEAWLILPLSEEQVSAYLKAALPGHDVDRLEKMLSEVHDLTDLSQRPFTLGLVVDAIPQIEAWRAEGKPIFGSTLYREFARQWLDRDKEKDKIETRHKYVLVEHLAAHMWRNDLTSVPVDDLEDWFRDWRQGQRGWADYEKLGPDKLNEALRNATFLSRVDKTANDGAFRFAHTSLQEFFLSEYLLRALRDDAPERWAMRVPSRETLDFLGQSLAETGGRQELATMARWFRGDNQAVNTDILAYRWQASWKGWPQVDLPVLFVDEGATSETIAPGEKVLLGGNVWRVLEVKEKAGTALLLSERVVAYRAYHAEFTEITWEKCTLRDWLNHDFVRSLPADFADLIVETPNENVDNPTYGTSGGRSTRDKVFLLSLEEVERYSTNSKASRVATRHDGDTWWWWLRSPGGGGSLAALVSYDGTVYDFGDNVTDAAGGVRPALTIRIPRS